MCVINCFMVLFDFHENDISILDEIRHVPLIRVKGFDYNFWGGFSHNSCLGIVWLTVEAWAIDVGQLLRLGERLVEGFVSNYITARLRILTITIKLYVLVKRKIGKKMNKLLWGYTQYSK